MKHFMIKYDRELPILLCQVVLNFVLEVLKKSGKSLEFYFICTVLTLNQACLLIPAIYITDPSSQNLIYAKLR